MDVLSGLSHALPGCARRNCRVSRLLPNAARMAAVLPSRASCKLGFAPVTKAHNQQFNYV